MIEQKANLKNMLNCIHCKACWRMCRMEKTLLKQCSEKCPYYVSKDAIKLISENDTDDMLDEIMSYIRRGVESIRDGYDQYDVYCTSDLWDYIPNGKTLGEIIDAQHEGVNDKND